MHAVAEMHALMMMQNVKSCIILLKVLVALISALTPNSSTSSSCNQEPYTMKHVFKKRKQRGGEGKSQLRIRKENDVDRKNKRKFWSGKNTFQTSKTIFYNGTQRQNLLEYMVNTEHTLRHKRSGLQGPCLRNRTTGRGASN